MKKRLSYLACYYVLLVLLFSAAKVLFMCCYREQQSFAAGDVADVLLHGLSLDLSTALYFLLVPFLLTAVSVWLRVPRWPFRAYYAVTAAAMALAFVADTSLYGFWQFKLDASWLQYLETPGEAVASVTTGWLLLRAAVAVAAAVLIFLLQCLVERATLHPSPLTPHPSPSSLHPSPLTLHLRETLLYVLLIPVIVVGIRGGIDESTTNIGQVYYSDRQFLNHAAVNPVFSFLYSASHRLDDLSQYAFFSDVESRRLADNVYTTESILTDTLLNTRRPDIVIILLESAGEQFAGVMPHLQQLKDEGVYFSRCYANSWRTDRGTVATLSGYPSFPTVSVMKMPEKSRSLPSIAGTLKRQGYSTSYLYGGDINFTNMRSYLIGTGWDHLTSKEDYPPQQRRTAQWGVRDDITFGTLLQLITTSTHDTPHLWGYSTLSSHEPWDVPEDYEARSAGDGARDRQYDEVENAFAYLDDCLHQFVTGLKASTQWENLLVVLIADHGILHGEVDHQRPLEKNHIPMLWIGGAVREPRTVDAICNQSDLCATLLGQLGLSHEEYTFSRDVLSRSYVYPTAVNNYSNAQWIVDSTGHVLYDFDARRFVVAESRDSERLLSVSKAMLQTTTNDLKNR